MNGYGILEEYRGQGFATEAVKLALKWAFRHSMVKAVEAEAGPDNAASQRVLMKCGFRPNGEIGEEGPRYIVYGGNEMDTNEYTIRLEKEEDYRAVENLVRESFWNVYRPGCSEHYVIHVLRDDPAFVKELDFVMEQDGKLIGQNMFMKTIIEADDSFFLCKELIPGYLHDVTGVYQTPQGYYVKDEDVEVFDRNFPPKAKLKLPGQIFG